MRTRHGSAGGWNLTIGWESRAAGSASPARPGWVWGGDKRWPGSVEEAGQTFWAEAPGLAAAWRPDRTWGSRKHRDRVVRELRGKERERKSPWALC